MRGVAADRKRLEQMREAQMTSQAALRSLKPGVRVWQAGAIYDFVRLRGDTGATCDECERLLGISHQSTSARIVELMGGGFLRLHPEAITRPTRSGRKARVYVSVIPYVPETPGESRQMRLMLAKVPSVDELARRGLLGPGLVQDNPDQNPKVLA
jgi:hypothetical protein